MLFIESPSYDPYFNLALEQYVFDFMDRSKTYFMLWRNENAIIVGRHQNTLAEINASFVRENGIRVVRRLSGGGAVYHDLGNINFTFITNQTEAAGFDFASFCRPVLLALGEFGVTAELSGRNDMTIAGSKFSGNAQYAKNGRVMHHGTILYDSRLDIVGQALNVQRAKIASKGLASARARVTNVRPHMPEDKDVESFIRSLKTFMFSCNDMRQYALTEEDLAGVRDLQERVYASWEWNYGRSPACAITKKHYFEGCGLIEAHMDISQGVLQQCVFSGDFFGNADPDELSKLLQGVRHEKEALCAVLEEVAIGEYFFNLTDEMFLRFILE